MQRTGYPAAFGGGGIKAGQCSEQDIPPPAAAGGLGQGNAKNRISRRLRRRGD